MPVSTSILHKHIFISTYKHKCASNGIAGVVVEVIKSKKLTTCNI